MDIVTPMMDTERPPKTIDRALALAVAEVVYELGDPTDPGRERLEEQALAAQK